MLKKALVTFIAIATLSLSLGLSGCFMPYDPDNGEGGGDGHNCVAGTSWDYDYDTHWNTCANDPNCIVKYNLEGHTFDPVTGDCVCGADNGGFLANGLEFRPYDNGYEVSRGTCELTVIDIPATFKNKPVLKVADEAFSCVFDDVKLTKVIIPDSVVEIGEGAFKGQSSLTEIVISATSNLEKINKEAFALRPGVDNNFPLIETLTLPSTLKYIGEDAFYIVSVNKLYFAGTLEQWMQVEFDYSVSGVCKPYNVEELYINGALLTEVNTGKATVLNCGPFDKVHSIEKVVIGSALEEIGEYAFHNCNSLSTVDMSGATSLKAIRSFSFATCESLTGLEVPYGVTCFEAGVYNWSRAMGYLKLPKSIMQLGMSNETDGTVPLKLYYEGTIDEWVQIDKTDKTVEGFNFSLFPVDELYVNGNQLVTDVVLTVTDIDIYSFTCYKKLESITYAPGTLETCELFNCTSLTTVNLPAGVKIVNSLSGCTLLENIDFPAGVEYIHDLSDCISLKDVVIPNTVKEIPCFTGVKANSIVFEENSQMVMDPEGRWVDFRNTEINTLILPEVNLRIYYSYFLGANIENLIFKEEFTLFGEFGLTQETSVTSFVGLNVTNLTVHLSNLQYFGTHVYYDEVNSIDSRNKIKNITVFGEGTLQTPAMRADYDDLETVTILDGITAITANVFGKKLESINIAESVINVASSAVNAKAVYCKATQKPNGWASDWVNGDATVEWGV